MGGGLILNTKKLAWFEYGGEPVLFGIAGTSAAARVLIHHLETETLPELPKWAYENDDGSIFQCIMYGPNGGLRLWNGYPWPIEIEDEFIAVGSGAQAAMAAIHLECGPREAVEIAARIDEDTGGKIITLAYDEILDGLTA
jgi:ATP-dependent protease HslVU (ClpYQ) peptidase subunit